MRPPNNSLEPIGSFTFQPEGWGLTRDSQQLILSDGTDVLRFLDPQTYNITGRLEVRDAGQPVHSLNELEVVNGDLLANIWQTDRIAWISLRSGEVMGWIDLAGILGDDDPPGVLNGIAYDARDQRLFVTGKNWAWLFEIELVLQR